jgi:hypothetical protein
VDGYPPGDRKQALQFGRVYQATAAFDHPDLPPVLGYGSSRIPGRPFIAYQLLPEARPPGDPLPAEQVAEILAEVQLLAHEAGLAGIHVPLLELKRVRAGQVVVRGRLPFCEFLADPRRPDGSSTIVSLFHRDEWEPFTAPEMFPGRFTRSASIRQALSYRVAAQLRYVLDGTIERSSSRHDGTRRTGTERAESVAEVPIGNRGRLWPFRSDIDGVLSASLGGNPSRRPSLESFMV